MNPKELGLNILGLLHRAQSGSAVAQTILGICCYLEGVEVEVNHQEAFRLLSAVANQGAPRAMANLAYMYAEGLGATKSLREAFPLYERAAEAGEFLAQLELARMYARGVGVAADPEMARKWYAAAEAQEASVGDCEELREAKAYSRKPS
jgi:TPR repeat protein